MLAQFWHEWEWTRMGSHFARDWKRSHQRTPRAPVGENVLHELDNDALSNDVFAQMCIVSSKEWRRDLAAFLVNFFFERWWSFTAERVIIPQWQGEVVLRCARFWFPRLRDQAEAIMGAIHRQGAARLRHHAETNSGSSSQTENSQRFRRFCLSTRCWTFQSYNRDNANFTDGQECRGDTHRCSSRTRCRHDLCCATPGAQIFRRCWDPGAAVAVHRYGGGHCWASCRRFCSLDIIKVVEVFPQHAFLKVLWNRRCVFPCLKCTPPCHSEACSSSSYCVEGSLLPQILFISKVVDIPRSTMIWCNIRCPWFTEDTRGTTIATDWSSGWYPWCGTVETIVEVQFPQILAEITKVVKMVR